MNENERTHHACFSGDVTCSGCDPCPACQRHVRACVLPVAVRAAGFDGALLADIHLLQDVIRAAAERMILHATRLDRLGLRTEADALRKDAGMLAIERIPVSSQAAYRTEEEQVRDLLAGYEAGWGRLHDAMENVDTVRAEVIRTQVREVAVPEPETQAAIEPPKEQPRSKSETRETVTADDVAAAIHPVEPDVVVVPEVNGVVAAPPSIPS